MGLTISTIDIWKSKDDDGRKFLWAKLLTLVSFQLFEKNLVNTQKFKNSLFKTAQLRHHAGHARNNVMMDQRKIKAKLTQPTYMQVNHSVENIFWKKEVDKKIRIVI